MKRPHSMTIRQWRIEQSKFRLDSLFERADSDLNESEGVIENENENENDNNHHCEFDFSPPLIKRQIGPSQMCRHRFATVQTQLQEHSSSFHTDDSYAQDKKAAKRTPRPARMHMYVHMCTYMHTCMHTCMHAYTHTTHTSGNVSISMYSSPIMSGNFLSDRQESSGISNDARRIECRQRPKDDFRTSKMLCLPIVVLFSTHVSAEATTAMYNNETKPSACFRKMLVSCDARPMHC